MAWQEINIGTAINAGDGEPIRNAYAKINAMMEELYGYLSTNGFNPDFIGANALLNAKLGKMPANTVKANLTGLADTPGDVTYPALAAALGLAPAITALSSAYTVVLADAGKFFNTTGTWTLSLPAAASVGNGFPFRIRNSGVGAITIDPNGAELVDGASTLVIPAKAEALIVCSGADWLSFGLDSEVLLEAGDVSAAPSLDMVLPAGYSLYRLHLMRVHPATNNVGMLMRFATDGVPTFLAGTSYRYAGRGYTSAAIEGLTSSDGGSGIVAMNSLSNTGGMASTANLVIQPGSASNRAGMNGTSSFNIGDHVSMVMGGEIKINGRATHVQIIMNSGNIANLSYRLIGIR